MNEQENKCTALIKYEPQPLAVVEPLSLVERLEVRVSSKRREVEKALEQGRIRDPVSIGLSIAAWALVGAEYAVVAGAGYLASRLLGGGRRTARTQRGGMSGEVQGLMRSEFGILIDEIYGGDPGDGKGGVKKPANIIYASKLRKTTHVEQTSTGGGKGFGGGHATQEVEVTIYDLDFAAMGGRGPLTLKREWANADKLIDLDKRGVYEGESSSNTFTAPYVITDNEQASDGRDVTLQPGGAVQFSITSNGAATRDQTIYYVNTATFTAEITVNGVASIVNFPNSSNNYTSVLISRALNNGANTFKIRNTSGSFNLRIDRIFCFPGLTGENTTGIRDDSADADDDYDNDGLPDASLDYDGPLGRHNFIPPRDGYDVITGDTNLGGYSNFAVYPGNDTQLPDPVIQADIDGKYGTGATPAYRNRAFTRHSAFQLERWGNVVPNITQLWEHATIKNLGQICSQWCVRVGMLTTDYDFSGLTSAKVRGMLISGRQYAPKDIMDESEEIYDALFYENEGKVYGILQSNAPTITIAESEIGWSEEESDDLPSLNTSIANEIDSPKRSSVKFIDPDRDHEPNTQDEARLVTTGKREEMLEVSITLTAAEARAVAAKRLYRAATESMSFSFTLSWAYLYLHPGYQINTTKNGNPLSIRLTQIKGGISILECEGVAVENAVLTQNVSTSGGGVFEKPPVPIPTMTVMTIMDLPVLRDIDLTINQGGGDHIAVAPRTSTTKAWKAAMVYMEVIDEYKPLKEFTSPCIMGTCVNAHATTANFTTKITSYTIDVDLYGSDAALANVTDAQASAGTAGLCVFGNEAIGVTTWTKLSGYPNRWRGTGFFRGRKGTTSAVATHVVGERFVLINASVKFIPRDYQADRNVTRNYKAVTAGQSFDDAATISYVWTGVSMTSVTTPPVTPTITFDGTSLINQVASVPSRYTQLQISSVNDENTFADAANLIWHGKSTKWSDSQLSTDPRSATRYFRVLGPWGNPSSIVPASYNVVAPSAPTVARISPSPATGINYRITAAVGYDTRRIKQTILEAVLDQGGGEVWNATNPNFRQYVRGGYTQTIPVPSTAFPAGRRYKVRAYFYDAFGPGTAGA